MSDKQTVKFGDICHEVKLTTKDPIADGYDRYIGLEHLDSGSLKIKRWGIIAEDNPSFTRVFKKGHILFGKRRPYLKKAAIAEFDGICSGDIIVLQKNDLHPISKLTKFIVQSDAFWEHAVKNSSGSLSPRTKYSSISKFEIQSLNSEKIKTSFSILEKTYLCVLKADRAYESIKTLIEKMLISELTGNEKNSISLKHMCTVISGQHIAASLYHDTPSGTPYLTGPDDFKEGKIEVTKYTNHPKAMCIPGDTLLTVKGSGVGKSVIADSEYCISRQLMSIRSKEVSSFFAFLLVQAIAGKLKELSSGVIPGITKSEVENFLVKNIRTNREKVEKTFKEILKEKETVKNQYKNNKYLLNTLTNRLLGI